MNKNANVQKNQREESNVMPKVVKYELCKRKQKFGVFSEGYTACAKCGKLVDDGGFFKGTNNWGCFDCLDSFKS